MSLKLSNGSNQDKKDNDNDKGNINTNTNIDEKINKTPITNGLIIALKTSLKKKVSLYTEFKFL